MNYVFLALLLVLLASAGAYWWYFMRKPQAGGEERVDMAGEDETVARPMPEESEGTDMRADAYTGTDADMGERESMPQGGDRDSEPMPQ